MDCSPPGFSVHGIFQARILEWVAMSISRVSSGLRDWTQFSSVAQSCPTLCDPMNRRPPCPSPTPGVHPNPCTLSRWYHPTISSSVVPFSCPQSFPTSRSFQMSQLFASGGQSIGVSASTSFLPMNTQDWSPLGWTGWISLQPKELWRVFSNTTVHKHCRKTLNCLSHQRIQISALLWG